MPVNDEVCFSNEAYPKRTQDMSLKNHHSLAAIVHQLEMTISLPVKKYCAKIYLGSTFFSNHSENCT